MKFNPIILNSDERLDKFNLLGGTIEVFSSTYSGDESNVILQASTGPGFGLPPHSHPWSETFYIIRGSIYFMLNGNECELQEGSMVYIPQGAVHAYSSGDNGVDMLEFTGESSQAVSLFKQLSSEITASPTDMDLLRRIFEENGASIHVAVQTL